MIFLTKRMNTTKINYFSEEEFVSFLNRFIGGREYRQPQNVISHSVPKKSRNESFKQHVSLMRVFL